jgi:hypothetical protein
MPSRILHSGGGVGHGRRCAVRGRYQRPLFSCVRRLERQDFMGIPHGLRSARGTGLICYRWQAIHRSAIWLGRGRRENASASQPDRHLGAPRSSARRLDLGIRIGLEKAARVQVSALRYDALLLALCSEFSYRVVPMNAALTGSGIDVAATRPMSRRAGRRRIAVAARSLALRYSTFSSYGERYAEALSLQGSCLSSWQHRATSGQ